MASPTINQSLGAFVSTTNVWDIGQLYTVDINSREFRELLVRLYQNVNNIASLLNLKDTGYYALDEFVNGQQYFPKPGTGSQQFRQVYRATYTVGPLPNTATTTIPHGIVINSATTFTRIYGAGSNTTGLTYLPLPFVSAVSVADNIQVTVDNTNIYITTGADYSAYDTAYIVLEYLKL